MIKIIRHGDRKRVVCEHCACIFTYEKEDTQTDQVDYNEMETYVYCPDCGERIKCERLS